MISLAYSNYIKTFDFQRSRSAVERDAINAVIEGQSLTPVFEAHNLNLSERRALLETKFAFPHKGEECSLFLLAVVCGHVNLTRALLEENLVDPEQKGTVLVGIHKDHDVKLCGFAYEIGEEVTPLWCAAAWCKLEVLKILVLHGASINCLSKGGSGPLFMACQHYDSSRVHNFVLGRPDAPIQLALVRYLIENGADVNVTARCGNTPLIAAAVSGFKDPSLVECLLENGAHPNVQNAQGSTALHAAAERGCLETVRVLTKHGALLQLLDCEGLSPLQRACCGLHDEVVEYLIALPECSREQKINALELLGASHATVTDIENIDYPSEGASDEEEDNDGTSIQHGYQFMLRAMKERFCPPTHIAKGAVSAPIPIYNNQRESQTLEELEVLGADNEAICMEGFIVRERILGALHSPEMLQTLMNKAVFLAHRGNKEKAMLFCSHALSFKLVSCAESKEILRRFLDHLCRMAEDEACISISDLEPLFQFVVASLEYLIQEKTNNLHDSNLSHFQLEEFTWAFDYDLLQAFYFICILGNASTSSEEEAGRKIAMVKTILALNLRNSAGAELIHLAVWDSIIPVHNKVAISEVFKVPNKKVLELLVQCGADINAQDDFGNSPLHMLATVDPKLAVVPDQFKQNGAKAFVDWFIENGAKLDLRNSAGERPVDVAVSEITKGFLQIW